MEEYEQLVQILHEKRVYVNDKAVLADKNKGYIEKYPNGMAIILINKNIKTTREKLYILKEEVGHLKVNYGDILDQEDITCIQQENKGRNWGVEQSVEVSDIIRAFEYGVSNEYELAEHLNIPEPSLYECIAVLAKDNGEFTMQELESNHYIVYFSPLMVQKLDTLGDNFNLIYKPE